MPKKKNQGTEWATGLGACVMTAGSMHQDIDGCGGCEYCEHESPQRGRRTTSFPRP